MRHWIYVCASPPSCFPSCTVIAIAHCHYLGGGFDRLLCIYVKSLQQSQTAADTNIRRFDTIHVVNLIDKLN